MRRSVPLLLVSLLALSSSVFAVYQAVSVPDIESAQEQVYKGFDELERLGAYVVDQDGEFLGTIGRSGRPNSLGNAYLRGNRYAPGGALNPYNPKSAANKYAMKPPRILVKSGGETYVVGAFTTNRYVLVKGQRIDPGMFQAWLDSK